MPYIQITENRPQPVANILQDILDLTGILKDKFPDGVDLKVERLKYLNDKYGKIPKIHF